MPARTWATEEESKWLQARLPDFLAARQGAAINEWYTKTYHQWFEEFPMPAPTEEEIAAAGSAEKALEQATNAKRSQVFWWYQNRTRGTGTGGKAKRAPMLKLDKRRRQLQPVHAYMKLYKAKIEPEIGQRWKDYLKTLASGETGEPWIVFYPRVARELLAVESEEVKNAVEIYRKAPDQSEEGLGHIPDEPAIRNAEQRKVLDKQRSIEGLARTIKHAFENIHEQTGWIGTVFLGGPDPRSGVYSSLVYSSGTTVAGGARWDQAEERWADIEKSWGDFVPKCFPPNHIDELAATYKSCYSRQHTPDGSSGEGSNQAQGSGQDKASSDAQTARPPTPLADESTRSPSETAVTQPHVSSDTPASTPAPSTSPVADQQTTPPPAALPAEFNEFEAEREQNLLRNRALLEDLGLAVGSVEKPVSRSRRNPRPKPKPTSSAAPRSLRSRDKEGAPDDTSAETGAQALPSTSEGVDPGTDIPDGEDEIDLPAWMRTGLEHLRKLSDNRRWQALLDDWVDHEAELGFPTGQGSATRLSKTGRPEEVDWWLRVGRRDYDKQPEIKDVAQYSAQWKQWWMNLQPDWREVTWPPKTEDDAKDRDWSVLRRGGCNAIFLVIVSLGWWYAKVMSGDDGNEQDALVAVDDVLFVLESMQPKTGRKRRYEDDEPTSNKRQALIA